MYFILIYKIYPICTSYIHVHYFLRKINASPVPYEIHKLYKI